MASKAKKAAVPRKKANGYKMPPPIPMGEVIHDTIAKKKWRIGPSIGVGGFGVIYSACDHESSPKKSQNYPFVVKIEPIENGPLFVEKHFYIRNGNGDDIEKFKKSKKLSNLGMPMYFGHGSHQYKGEKFRYLVLERYGKDVWSLFLDSGRSFPPTTVFQLGLQMLDVLEYIHSRGYVHADLKGANILMGLKKGTENQAYLVDFGLASRVNDKEFKPDPKCAHNGTIEYTSRDAHLGVPTMRGDLEILAYNMLQWLIGELPWEKELKHPKTVQQMKETFMNNVRSRLDQYTGVPNQLVKFFEYINTVGPKSLPDYTKCRQLFESYLKNEGKTATSKLESISSNKKSKTSKMGIQAIDSNGDIKSSNDNLKKGIKKTKTSNEVQKTSKRGRKINKEIENEKGDSENENGENEIPDSISVEKQVTKKNQKRKSSEPALLVKVKKAKMAPKATPPTKKNHANIATQTSTERPRRSPRQVTFDSPISEVLGSKRSTLSVNSSGDIFDDSFVIEEKKVKTKKKLLSSEEVSVKRVVKKKVSTVNPKSKSWKNCPTIVNGRSPPT